MTAWIGRNAGAMSSLLGRASEPWPLSRAIDALGDAARRAGVPGLVWIAGIAYPSLSISVELAQSLIGALERWIGVDLPGGTASLLPVLDSFGPSGLVVSIKNNNPIVQIAMLAVPFLILYRLVVGLARLSDPVLWSREARERSGLVEVHVTMGKGLDVDELSQRTVRLKEVWEAGAGQAASALGLWLVLLLLLGVATAALVGLPLLLLQAAGLLTWLPLFVGLLLPPFALVLFYALVLQVLNQLALHSLAHNDRGVASALTHAWRLMRASPASAARAALVELLLFATVLAMAAAPRLLFDADSLPARLALVALFGFAGVTRACFWGTAYRDFGGLSADDAIPGLRKRRDPDPSSASASA